MSTMPPLRRLLLTAGAAAVALLLAAQTSAAQPAPTPDPKMETAPGVTVPLLADPENKNTRVERTTRAGAPRTASFIVTYNGFSPQAQTAFQAAVDIWASQITSSVPIRITANWTPLGTGVLGQAGPTVLTRDFGGAPYAGTWYPIALANKLAGTDLAPTQADIVASFNSNFSNWYLGTTGPAPAGTYDFVSVVLHEIGHGLGFIGSMTVSGGQGGWGSGGFPFIYDRFSENNAGSDLINTATFPNPSATLASQLTGQTGGVYWNGSYAVSAAGGARPRLYAPNPWQSGSSYSHLNESSYPAGNANSLMTPQLGQAETIHDPGPIGRGVLRDLGWSVDGTAPTPSPAPTASPGASPTPSPSGTPGPTPTPGSTPPPKPGTVSSPTPRPSATPAPTTAPTPTPTPTPTPAPTRPPKLPQ